MESFDDKTQTSTSEIKKSNVSKEVSVNYSTKAFHYREFEIEVARDEEDASENLIIFKGMKGREDNILSIKNHDDTVQYVSKNINAKFISRMIKAKCDFRREITHKIIAAAFDVCANGPMGIRRVRNSEI